MDKTNKAQAAIGAGTILCAVAALFWWGTHFEVFGRDIDWLGRPEQLVMPLLLVVAAFGAGLMLGGPRLGVRISVWTAVIFIGLAALGAVRRAI
jgi:hypothetical protein